jgi:hypothetical protein
VEILRESSQDEYFKFYLERQCRKGQAKCVPDTPEGRRCEMKRHHEGKILPHPHCREIAWSMVRLDFDDFGRLVFAEVPWTESFVQPHAGTIDYRLLRNVASRPEAQPFVRESHGMDRHYYMEMQHRKYVPLQGDDKIAVSTPQPEEQRANPSGLYYLHDGNGRCLAYMVLILQGKLKPEPVEAFLCEQASRGARSGA